MPRAPGIRAAWIPGSGRRLCGDDSSPHALVTGQNNPTGVAADGSHLYWAASTAGSEHGAIWEANLDGTGAHAIVTGQAFPNELAIGP